MKRNFIIGVFSALLISQVSYAQSDGVSESDTILSEVVVDDFFSMSLEDLLNTPISVASKTGLSQRESPGIVTLISTEEIKNSGARDLVDVLRLVPGIQFGTDVEGIVGISMRGNWGHEGKVLMLIDGHEVNENLFSTLQFGNHYDVNQIKRIEIIRGPGSSIYCGNAELGVINIITKSGKYLKGANASLVYGQLDGAVGRTNVSAAVGDKVGDLDYSVSFFGGTGNRSEDTFVDWWGGEEDLAGNNTLKTVNVNAKVKFKGLRAGFMYDDYEANTVVMFDEAIDADSLIDLRFKTLVGELAYDWEISDKVTVTPQFNLAKYTSWNTINEASREIDALYDVEGSKITGGLHTSYNPNDQINIIGGVEHFVESAINVYEESTPAFYTDEDDISFNTSAVYLQGLLKSKYGNWVLGGRMINHSQFGTKNRCY